ncbi:MAG: VWA domain-containing protein [Candidatus Gracilibacteria bacterium]|nr:VWA domain-containing protein [Candidatus Gracilibacteria bacterium]
MVFSNLNIQTITLFTILFLLGIVLLFLIGKKNKNISSIIFLFLSFLFILINIFEIKGGYNSEIVKFESGRILFVVDVSKSMDANDVLEYSNNISRMNLSKYMINTYIGKNLSNLYGLIIFAGEAIETLPFTNEITLFKNVINSLDSNKISLVGTNLNSVFESINDYFFLENYGGLVVVFTDGGDENIEISDNLMKLIKNNGVKILLVGVGTSSGGRIPLGTDNMGKIIYKKYNGNELLTRLNKDQLIRLSNTYNFSYMSIDNIDSYNELEKSIDENIKKISMEKNISYRIDYTRFFILISFVFFVLFLIFDNFVGIKKS